MSPMEVLGIYENFATGGFKYPTRAIRSVVDANGRLLDRYGQTYNKPLIHLSVIS